MAFAVDYGLQGLERFLECAGAALNVYQREELRILRSFMLCLELGNKVTLDGCQVSLKKGLLGICWHFFQVLFDDTSQSLADYPEPQLWRLRSSLFTLDLIEKLGPLHSILVDEPLQIGLS